MSRFGASKYRNAVPNLPPREEWYRSSLPPSTSTSSALSTFTSEVKTNRTWIVTLNAAGDLSYRPYEATGPDSGSKIGTLKVGSGGGVGDWDLSRLEDGTLVVGGLDGAISVYTLPSSATAAVQPLQLIHTISGSSSPITHLLLHPTTPSILLASTIAVPLSIYDLSSSPTSPSIELVAKELKGLWSIGWSSDGRKVAAIGRSGTAYIFDPRSSAEATVTRVLPIQPLKPARLAWVGDDAIFVTAFSKMRNREYHLFSGTDLTTKFTNTLDTSPGLLLPLVDQERRIVYLSARGDMSLRQVELSGPQGYQETIHPLPAQLASASLALAHPALLPVMSAQIATVLILQVDKDGDALVPFGIKVPRRQLIDYHEDLYPDMVGTIPEQNTEEWLKGGDKAPLLISLDPARRGVWEKQLASVTASTPTPGDSQSKMPASLATHSEASKPVTQAVIPQTALVEPDPEIASSSATPSQAVERENPSEPTSPSQSKSIPDSRPPVEDGESYSSTSYKARIMGHHIAQQLDIHRNDGKQGPLMVGLQGPQGCGKTTLCNALLDYLQQSPRNLKIAVLSLDDLYKTNQGLKDVAAQHPDNKMLAGRGPPGTHDSQLASSVLASVQAINDGSNTVDLPIFDKSLCGGEGDRSQDTIKVKGPIDVFILEGWSMGFGALPEQELRERYESKATLSDTSYFLTHPLSSLLTLNTFLSDFSKIYSPFGTFVQIEPESYNHVFEWRLEQEHNMKKANGGKGMSDEQVHKFVERYMPGYELWKEGVWSESQPWSGRGLRLWYGKGREIIKVEVPPGKADLPPNEDKGKSIPPPPPTASAVPPAPHTTPPRPTPTAVSPPVPTTQKTETATASTPSVSVSTPSKPFNPSWSRKFLAGKSPLNPTYDQIPSLSTLHQDSHILKSTPHFIFFPVQGPGGRLGVHPLKKKGRMSVGGEGYLSGGVEIADFDVELFRDGRVAIAGEDGLVRVWRIPEDGLHGVGPESEQVLKGDGVDKIVQVAFHPTAKDLLVLATNDRGTASIRFFDLSKSSEQLVTPLPQTSGVFNIAFSPDASRLAAAIKDGRILVLDPRGPPTAISGKAHDSPRSFQMVWIDETHLISVGFSKGSQRRINLYSIPLLPPSEITTLHSLLIDVSPSVLFPAYDPDTSILYIWGKGERQIQAYEVHPDHPNEPIAKLPSFTSGSPQLGLSFLPKRLVDVKKVEVAKCLRLTAKTIEEVTFSIPRNKPDFFQDDIYRETVDVENPIISAGEWLQGHNGDIKWISLKPEGMTPLSQAPQTTSKAKAKFVPAKDILSEEEKKKREMDALFAKAKMDESSDEDDEPKRTGLDPPDDDW